jgi:UDP-N-acetylglucosamine 2-epimerase (non-hydrolysing)
MKKILIVFGTRPEAIKMAPVVSALQAHPDFETRVCVTAQHRDMLDQVLTLFEIVPDYDLDLMTTGQTLADISARVLLGITGVLAQWTPDLVLVHGDTSTTAMTATACFYQRIPVGHVEAGLRTGNMWSPWPEEFNRRLTGLVTRLHFAPTEQSRANLLAEKIPADWIEVTGNTVIDALLHVSNRIDHDQKLQAQFHKKFNFLDARKRILLVTGHRRENFGDGMQSICRGLLAVSKRDDLEIVYPVHRNPNVTGPVEEHLDNQPNIHLLAPQDYLSFVYLMKRSHIILTDSGGIQEEAPSLGKPVLVMRDTTERPEAVAAGTVRLVGANAGNIVAAICQLLDEPVLYASMSNCRNPYGDGRAASRIVARLTGFLTKDTESSQPLAETI